MTPAVEFMFILVNPELKHANNMHSTSSHIYSTWIIKPLGMSEAKESGRHSRELGDLIKDVSRPGVLCVPSLVARKHSLPSVTVTDIMTYCSYRDMSAYCS